MHWIRQHPYLTGSLVLVGIILFVIIRRAGSSSSTATQATYNPSADPSLLAAQLAASTQLQGQQTAATVAQNQTNAQLAAVQTQAASQVQIAQLAQQAQLQSIVTGGQVTNQANAYQFETAKAQTGAQVSIAGLQTQGALGLAQIQTAGQVAIAGQAAQVNQDQIAAALAEQQSINQTQLGLAQTNASVNIANIMGQTQLGLAAQQTQQLGITTQGNIDYTQLVQQGQTQRLGITTAGSIAGQQLATQKALGQGQVTVDLSAISAQKALGLSQINAQTGEFNAGLGAVTGGAFNLGGMGGQNTLSAFSALTGQPAIGVASQQAGAINTQSSNSFWGGIWNSIIGLAPSTNLNFGGSPQGSSSSSISFPSFGG